MFNKDTNKATNCPRAVLEAFSGESKDTGAVYSCDAQLCAKCEFNE